MLYCVECKCCSELGRGWVAMRCDDEDPVDGDITPAIAFYCPPCAAREFDYKPAVAANYRCQWEQRQPIARRAAGGNELHDV